MAATRIRPEDLAGIGLAVVAHIALLVWLVLRREPPPPPPPRTVTVTLEAPVSAEAGSPSREEAAAAAAPLLSEDPAPLAAAEPAVPEPPRAAPQPQPLAPKPAPPKPTPPKPEAARPVPQPVRPAPPRPQPKAPAPASQPAPRAQPRPVAPVPKAAAPARTAPARTSRIGDNFLPALPKGAPTGQRRPPGASRIGDNFLPGASTGSGKAATPPGPAITPELRMSFAQAVLRQVRPNWQGRVPQGLEVEKLVSVISVELNRDGSIAGEPVLVRQEGINDANRSQARRHGEEAIRAVKLSAPFRLPPEAYEGWKKLPPLRFRKGI
ncbi:MAG: hypothetical protein ACKOPQ_14805 [Novosphingobium sp.]|jgi:outer membrane biosynthesis protein TonB